MNRLPTLSDAVATHARLAPNKLAARDSRRAMTFTALNQRVQRLAEGLCGLGLSTGDRVAVLAYNCVEWVEIYAALARAGLVAVPINFRLTGPEVAYIVSDADVRAVIAGAVKLLTGAQVHSISGWKPARKAAFPVPVVTERAA